MPDSNTDTNSDTSTESEREADANQELPAPLADADSGDRGGDGDESRLQRLQQAVNWRAVGIGVVVLFGLVLAVAVLVVAPSLLRVALIALIVGFVPGVTLFPWLASPFGPGLWLLNEPFARIQLTVSQFIRRAGVLVKRSSNEYEIGTYLPDAGEVVLSDTRLDLDEDNLSWGLFGKRKFGVTWEAGTDFHNRVRSSAAGEAVADGGEAESGTEVNVAAAHRYFEGANDADAIFRTEEKAEAEYGGGGDGLSGVVMAALVGVMLVLGWLTTFLMV